MAVLSGDEAVDKALNLRCFLFLFFAFEAFKAQAVNLASSYKHPDKNFAAPSFRAGNEPFEARLSNSMGAWLPCDTNNTDDYLEIELGDVFFICAAATQGHPHRQEWVKSYKLHLFLRNWIIYKAKNTKRV